MNKKVQTDTAGLKALAEQLKESRKELKSGKGKLLISLKYLREPRGLLVCNMI